MRAAIAILVLTIVIQGAVWCAEPEETDEFYTSLEEALLDMGMTPGDFRIRHDYAEPDVFRLPLVDSLMHDPASLLRRMDGLAARLQAAPSLISCSSLLWKAMSVTPERAQAPEVSPPGPRDVAGRLAHLPPALERAVTGYLVHLEKMAGLRDRAIEGLTSDLDFLYRSVPLILGPSPDYEEVDPLELHRLEKAEEALNDSVLAVLEQVDVRCVAGLSLEALLAAGDIERVLKGIAPGMGGSKRYGGRGVRLSGRSSSVGGRVIYMGLTPHGVIAIGDTTRNVYDGCFALIIDPGGDDIYNLSNDDNVHYRTIVDSEGDDLYRSSDISGVAGAMMGTAVILDLAGNDSYRAGEVSLGAAVCGLGVIEDRDGDDSYTSGTFSQGAGFLGLGILKDDGGHDTYVARMQSQAFGYVMGSGLLLDTGGNDTYHTQMSQTDILRYDDHYLTLSQGCAFGSRPDYSGGIGLLVDSQGNDTYVSDIFGQGVAYWFAAGALIDRGGHDRYCSYQYAQGAGIHLAFGLLLDNSGDDGYFSKGVSQGCGHDLSLGLLADFSGNDWYTATDLSQGAGNANGTGIIYDADGNDVYAAKSEINVNGYGDYRREFGSIGLHVDAGGKDYYSARGENGFLWESGRYGLGVDMPGEATRPGGDLVVKEYALQAKDFTPEELFILSSRGEPRFRQWRKYAFDRMVEDTLLTVQYLRTVLGTKDARERHTIKDILREIGEASVPMLAEAVLEDGPRAKSEAAWILGIIGSPEAFDALLELSRDEGWKQRSSAVNAMGKLKDLPPENLDRLRERLDEILRDPGEVFYVRKDAAYACGAQNICGLLTRLVGALGDPHHAVRFSAAEAIRELSEAGRRDVAGEITRHLAAMDKVGMAAAFHAAQDLSPGEKLDLLEAALAEQEEITPGAEVAFARLLSGIKVASPGDRERLDTLKARLPEGSWKTRALAGAE